jgi:hypothetical protein
MNLFKEYKALRSKYNMRAEHAYNVVRSKAAQDWRVALRGWDFDLRGICSDMTSSHDTVWSHRLPSGHVLDVRASYDCDYNPLEGLCTVDLHNHKEYQNQWVVSHEEGTYWVETDREYALIELDDGGLCVDWYRKQGMSKQVAIETAIESRRAMVDWIEMCLKNDVAYGCIEVIIQRDIGGVAAPFAFAGPIGGVELGSGNEYLREALEDLLAEAEGGLNLTQ